MTIHSDRNNLAENILLAACSALFEVLLYVRVGNRTVVFCSGAVLLFLVLQRWVSSGRRIDMDAHGCTVSFLWFRRRYKWEDLCYRRFVDQGNALGYRRICDGGAEFSTKPLKRPKWLACYDYSKWCHPFAFWYFFVYFPPTNMTPAKKEEPFIYMVDEKLFQNKMIEWGIDISYK